MATACARTSSSVTMRPISLLSSVTTSDGVAAGAIAICHEVMSKSATVSSIGGVSGRAATRAFDVTASARSFPS